VATVTIHSVELTFEQLAICLLSVVNVIEAPPAPPLIASDADAGYNFKSLAPPLRTVTVAPTGVNALSFTPVLAAAVVTLLTNPVKSVASAIVVPAAVTAALTGSCGKASIVGFPNFAACSAGIPNPIKSVTNGILLPLKQGR
jgi:hypothetical protein